MNAPDEPSGAIYEINIIAKDGIYFYNFNLDFREDPCLDLYFRQDVQEMIAITEVNLSGASGLEYKQSPVGDFKIVIRKNLLFPHNNMPFLLNYIMKSYYNLKYLAVKEETYFLLDQRNLVIEKYPLVFTSHTSSKLKRKSFEKHKVEL